MFADSDAGSICASDITMPTESALDLPLIDHHCHGISPAELDYKRFQAMFSRKLSAAAARHQRVPEAARPGHPRASARRCSISSRMCRGEAYVERRLALGAAEVNRRFMRGRAAGMPAGRYRPSLQRDPSASRRLAQVAGKPAHEVVRIEAVAEEVATSGVSAGEFRQGLRRPRSTSARQTPSASRPSSPIAAPSRSTRRAPTQGEVDRRRGRLVPQAAAGTGKFRVWTIRRIIRHGLWIGARALPRAQVPAAGACRLRRSGHLHACLRSDAFHRLHRRDGEVAGADHAAAQLAVPARGGVALGDLPECLLRCRRDPELRRGRFRATSSARRWRSGSSQAALFLSDAFGLSRALLSRRLAVPPRRCKQRLDRWIAEDFCT